ncbi:nicotinate-nucleotide adenylyltransferase [Planctomicrobium sp. SH664]|uniref:nicotinate-nucleotide adenylyltransferase n=1 Tax=Planctomicrobium sp. SH664 TaxID=3448125 RepID=UPI003F5B1975
MRLGIFGGTFDPIHLAHLILAETAREACQLDEVWFVPTFVSPHKEGLAATPPAARLEMVKFAIAGHPQFRVSDLEVKRRQVSYTVDTLREIHTRHPEHELFLLMGADSLGDFLTWKEPQQILQLAKVVAVNRGRGVPDPANVIAALGNEAVERIQTIDMPLIGISASDIRHRCETGQSVRYLTPRSVEMYLQQHRLYQR